MVELPNSKAKAISTSKSVDMSLSSDKNKGGRVVRQRGGTSASTSAGANVSNTTPPRPTSLASSQTGVTDLKRQVEIYRHREIVLNAAIKAARSQAAQITTRLHKCMDVEKEVIKVAGSYTGQFLKTILNK